MPGDAEIAILVLTVTLLLLSGVWTERRYRGFEQIPAHYDIVGKPTRYASRKVMAWLLPLSFSVLFTVMVFAIANVPEELRNGDQLAGVLIGSLTLLGAQAFVLWILSRWARNQS